MEKGVSPLIDFNYEIHRKEVPSFIFLFLKNK